MKISEILTPDDHNETGYMMLRDVNNALRTKKYANFVDALANRLPPSTVTREKLIPLLEKHKSTIVKNLLRLMKGRDDDETEDGYEDGHAVFNLPGAIMMLRRLVSWPELNIIYKSMKAEPNRYYKYQSQVIMWDY